MEILNRLNTSQKVMWALLIGSVVLIGIGLIISFALERYLESITWFYFGGIFLIFSFFGLRNLTLEKPISQVFLLFLILLLGYCLLGWFFPKIIWLYGKFALVLFLCFAWIQMNFRMHKNQVKKLYLLVIPLLAGISLLIGLKNEPADLRFLYFTFGLLTLQTVFTFFILLKKKD